MGVYLGREIMRVYLGSENVQFNVPETSVLAVPTLGESAFNETLMTDSGDEGLIYISASLYNDFLNADY